MRKFFEDFDFSEFWLDHDHSQKDYIEEPPTDELIASVEEELGYKLPAAYIELMRLHNGGIVAKFCYPLDNDDPNELDEIFINGIMGIGRNKPYSLCGERGSKFRVDEWEYPDIGVYICDTPSAGHEMILLDYSKCGKNGEPEVFHVDQESDYHKTFLAKNFEEFIRGLTVFEEDFEE